MGEQLNVLSWNCNGLTREKKEDPDFAQYLRSYDIIFLYESWCNSISDIDLNGFRTINLYRKFQNKNARRNSGGIVIYFKSHLKNGISLVRNHFDTIVWLHLKKEFFHLQSDVYLCGIYLWGENSPSYNVHNVDLFQILQDDVNCFNDLGYVFVCGDFNSRVGSRLDFIEQDIYSDFIDNHNYKPDTYLYRCTQDQTVNTFGHKLLDLCRSTSLRIANGRLGNDKVGTFTFANYNSHSVIDYLLLNEAGFKHINDFTIHSFTEWSDHAPLSFSIDCYAVANKSTETRFIYHKWNGNCLGEFRKRMISKLPEFNRLFIDNDNTFSNENVNDVLSRFCTIFRSVTDEMFSREIIQSNEPRFKETRKNAVWFDSECRDSKRIYYDAMTVYNRCKTQENREYMSKMKQNYKKIVRKHKSLYYRKQYKSIENLRHSKPKDFWNLFCRKKAAPSNNISIDEFYNYFSKLADDITNVHVPEAETFCENNDFNSSFCNFDELDQPITLREVEYAIHNLNRNKAMGSDCLINEYFIESCDIISSHLVDLFNIIFNSGYFPDQWSEGIIIPLHKKNDPDDINNYRGITLVSCLSKIFTGILNRRLSYICEENEILSDAQFGFRPKRSTTDASFVLLSHIQRALSQNKRLYAAFIDFKKAFDSVYRKGLWYKLFGLGVNGKMLRIIRDMYSKVKAFVKVNNITSPTFDSHIGLKQGEIMSPLLFSLFIDDIELYLQGDTSSGLNLGDVQILLLLFADDMVILSENPNDLQNSLNKLLDYCNKWGLEVNTEKTKVVVFRKKGALRCNETWYYNGKKLEVVNDFHYLGTTFSHTGSFSNNTRTLSNKALKALNILNSKTRCFDFETSTLLQLFDAFVGSILSYSCEINGFCKSQSLERIHLKQCKKLLNVKSSTSNAAVYHELGRYPLYINRYCRIIKFWGKLVLSDNLVIRSSYEALLACNERGDNWCSNVKKLLTRHGFGYVWNDPFCVNHKSFYNVFKQRLIDEFRQGLYNEINTRPVLCTYKFIKEYSELAFYLNILPRQWRSYISKFRLSSHSLRIETGRHGQNRIVRNQRLCFACNMNEVEDEYHFLLVCPFFADVRKLFLKKYFYTRPSMLKYKKLMNTNNKGVLLNLAKFIKEGFSRRTAIEFNT